MWMSLLQLRGLPHNDTSLRLDSRARYTSQDKETTLKKSACASFKRASS